MAIFRVWNRITRMSEVQHWPAVWIIELRPFVLASIGISFRASAQICTLADCKLRLYSPY